MRKQTLSKAARKPVRRADVPAGEKKSRLWRQRYTLIARQPFFMGLTPQQLELLTDCSMQMRFLPDQVVFREGHPANRFFLILKGRVALETQGPRRSIVHLQTLGPGDDLGWSWLFPPYTLHFSARAVTPAQAIFFYGTRLREQCEQDHDLGYRLMKRIAGVMLQRLQASRQQSTEAAFAGGALSSNGY